jgi:hypothetical protein
MAPLALDRNGSSSRLRGDKTVAFFPLNRKQKILPRQDQKQWRFMQDVPKAVKRLNAFP